MKNKKEFPSYIIKQRDLESIFDHLSAEFYILVPGKNAEIVPYVSGMEMDWDSLPVWGALKDIIFPRQYIYGAAKNNDNKKTLIIGLRGCDMSAAAILDTVFLEDCKEDSYTELRKNIICITLDCIKPAFSCLCGMVGDVPFTARSDINFSFIGDKILVSLINEERAGFLRSFLKTKAVKQDHEQQRDIRDTATRIVKKNYSCKDEAEVFLRYEDELVKEQYRKISENCINCGACNYVCPTCHCFSAKNIGSPGRFKKLRTWTSCQHRNYHKETFFRNSIERAWQRQAYRILCKFEFMKKEHGRSGCTGCGRCIRVCPSGIDMRDYFKIG